jgi:hypothetical protein
MDRVISKIWSRLRKRLSQEGVLKAYVLGIGVIFVNIKVLTLFVAFDASTRVTLALYRYVDKLKKFSLY